MKRKPKPALKATIAKRARVPKGTAKPRAAKPKAGRSTLATAARIAAFAAAYMTNGHNATGAAKSAGCTGSQVANAGWKLLHHPEVQAILAASARRVSELADMNLANWAAELRAVVFSRSGDVYGDDGQLVPVAQLPAHVQSAIASIKVRTTADGDQIVEYKRWSKTAALEIMARHLGLYEKDNAQQKSDILVRVELVG
jgi:hypothetical protein